VTDLGKKNIQSFIQIVIITIYIIMAPAPENEYELVEGQQKQQQSKENNNEITLSWQNISYSIQNDKEIKTILHPISGVAYPGELMAIMGTSGAGKSTLLDCLGNTITITIIVIIIISILLSSLSSLSLKLEEL